MGTWQQFEVEHLSHYLKAVMLRVKFLIITSEVHFFYFHAYVALTANSSLSTVFHHTKRNGRMIMKAVQQNLVNHNVNVVFLPD